jgi:hypothetical protein
MIADTTEKEMVENVGVRYLGWILPKMAGSALWKAMDRVVRAFGRMVVWVVAALEVRTMRSSSRVSTVPSRLCPKIASPN